MLLQQVIHWPTRVVHDENRYTYLSHIFIGSPGGRAEQRRDWRNQARNVHAEETIAMVLGFLGVTNFTWLCFYDTPPTAPLSPLCLKHENYILFAQRKHLVLIRVLGYCKTLS